MVYGPVTGGGKEATVPVTVDPKALSRILHSESGANTIISLELDGATTPVLVKDFLLHPVTHALLHADFYRVAMDRKLTVTVPVTVKGEAAGREAAGRRPRLRHARVRDRGACRATSPSTSKWTSPSS